MTIELDADTYSDKRLPRAVAASQPSDTEDIPQEEAVMQGKEKGSPLVNLSLTIVMSCACYSPLSNFISFSVSVLIYIDVYPLNFALSDQWELM